MNEYFVFEYFLDANKRVYFLYLITSILLALIYLYFNPKQRRINLSSKLWLHKSSKLDYSYFLLSYVIKILLIFPLVLSAKTVATYTILFLINNFNFISLTWSYETIIIVFTFTLFTLSDLSRYFLHRLLHAVPFLWEFHKVHHSAKVLNPFTFYRVHPIENILFGFRYVLTIGVTTGVFIYLFAGKIDIYDVLGVNIFSFIFSVLGSNLRHSHIKLKYPKFIEIFLISPYMHQIHHSTKHFDKNYGGYLSVWDYLFKTHVHSSEVKKIIFGLKKEQMKDYDTLIKLLITPFKTLKSSN